MLEAAQRDSVARRSQYVSAAAAEALAHPVIGENDAVVDQEALNPRTALFGRQPRQELVERHVAEVELRKTVGTRQLLDANAVDRLRDIDRLGDRRAIGVPRVHQRQRLVQFAQAARSVAHIRFDARESLPDRRLGAAAAPAIGLPAVDEMELAARRIDRQQAVQDGVAIDVLLIELEVAPQEIADFAQLRRLEIIGQGQLADELLFAESG